MLVLGSNGSPRTAPLAWRGAEILVLSPTPTHPQDYGNRKRIFGVCSRLVRRGARITFVHYPADPEWRRRVPAAAAAMTRAWDACYTVPVTRPLHQAAQSADHMIDEWWDEAISGFLRWLFQVASFDVFIVNYSWLSKAFDVTPGGIVKILDTHDRLAGRRSLLEAQGIAPEFFHTTDEEEAKALSRADLVWAIKDEERTHFERLTASPVFTLAHLDPVRPLPSPAPDPDGYLRVGVIGARNNLNLVNLRGFLAAAIPIFERFFAPVMICVAGGMCDGLRGVDERFVRLVGRVADVEDFYRGIDLVCIAMRSSTGLKTKTAEAIALGLPVVSLAHGFEGFFARHPLHRLTSFEAMAERLVDLAFDRDLLIDLRAASLAAANASETGIEATIERSWQVVARLRRSVTYCVSTAVFDDAAPERSAFISALEYLEPMANVTVLLVEGSVEPLLRAVRGLESRARIVVGAPLVNSEANAAALRDRGFGIAAIDDVLAASGNSIVVVDAWSEPLRHIAATTGMVVLRAELLAQRMAIEPQLDALALFLGKFAHPVVMAPCSSPPVAALAAGAGADIVTAPCCWRSDAARTRIDGRQRPRQVLLLTDGRLRGLTALQRLVRDVGLEPILVRPLEAEQRSSMPFAAGGAGDRPSAPQYLSALIGGRQALPEFAVDLSFGALGLQYLREILLRFAVPMICADIAIMQPPVVVADAPDHVHTYEALVQAILAAARGDPLSDEAQRHRLDLELESDAGWAWLWRHGHDALGFAGIGPAWPAAVAD